MKKIIKVLVISVATISLIMMLASCGDVVENKESAYYGTWDAVCVNVDGSEITIEELETAGDYSLSDFRIVIKKGGQAYIYSEGLGDFVDWALNDDGITIGVRDCYLEDDFLCIENNDIVIYLEKTSDSQRVSKPDVETDSDSNEITEDSDKSEGKEEVSAISKLNELEKSIFDVIVMNISSFNNPSSVKIVTPIASYYDSKIMLLSITAENKFGGSSTETYIITTSDFYSLDAYRAVNLPGGYGPAMEEGKHNVKKGCCFSLTSIGDPYDYEDRTEIDSWYFMLYQIYTYGESSDFSMDVTTYKLNAALDEYNEIMGW